MCNESVDDFLTALKLISDWHVLRKIIEKVYTALYADDGSLFLMKILMMPLFYDEDGPDAIILIKLLAW